MRRTTLLLLLVAAPSVAFAQGPPGTLLVLNKDEAALVKVDPASGKVTARVPTGEGPHELVVSSDGKLAFASNYGAQAPGSSISVIDVASMKELHRVDLSPLRRPHGLWFADGKLYFTAETNRLVGRYDPASNKVDWVLGTGQNATHMVVANADASRLFTSNIGSDSVTIIERGANPLAWNETVVPVGKGPEGLDLSPDGKELWSAHSRDGGVSIVDVAAKKVTQTIDIGTKRSNRLKFTPDGKTVLVSDIDTGQLVVVDVASRQVTRRVDLGKSPEGILIVPEGSYAFVAVTGDNNIAVVDLKTWTVTRRISPGAGPDGMAWISAR